MQARWKRFNRANVGSESQSRGNYEIADKNRKMLYVGKGYLRDRLQRHFPTRAMPIRGAYFYRSEVTSNNETAKAKEKAHIKAHHTKRNKRIG